MALRIDPDSLRSLSSSTTYERGSAYAGRGLVGRVVQQDATVRATVTGSEPYRVRLVLDHDGLAGDCTCPVGTEGAFCKHCVALAVVWSAHGPDHYMKLRAESEEPDIEDAARTLPYDDLIDVVVGAGERIPALASELLARAGMLPDPEAPTLAVMRARVASALPEEPLETWDAAGDIEQLVDELTDLVHSACSDDVVALLEEAIRRWDTAVEVVEHDAPEITGLGERLGDLHHEGCRIARPDPHTLAPRLLDLHLDGHVLMDNPTDYADVLGQEGADALEAEVWCRFAELSPSSPGDSPAYDHQREATIQHAISFAENAGDTGLLVTALAKNLSRASTYTRIVEALRAASRSEEALRWGEEGLAAFDGRVDVHLLDTVLSIHEAVTQVDNARACVRRAFAADPRLETYQRLATWCRDVPEWAEEREAAIVTVRENLAQPRSQRAFHWGVPERVPETQDLVRLLLWDDDGDAAWEEAQKLAASLSERMWLQVAEHRGRTHPLDAVPIYQRQAERDIELRKNHTYASAAESIRRAGELLRQAGQEEEFSAYVARIRRVHKPKRNLMAAMNAAHLP